MAKERIQHPEKFSPRIVFRTATVCNFKCPMCPHGNPHMAPIISAGKDMPMSLYSEALQNISQYTNKVGLSDTGEFMAEPDWKKKVKIIVDQAKKNPDLMFHQITNASLLTKKNLRHLNGLKKVTFLISIDGNEFLTYHTIRKPGSLHKTLPNIKKLRRNLKEVGITDVSIQLSMVLLKRNIFSLPSMIMLAKEVDAILFVDHVQSQLAWKNVGETIPFDSMVDFAQKESLYNYPVFANQMISMAKALALKEGVTLRAPPPFAVNQMEVEELTSNEADGNIKKYCESLDEWGPIGVGHDGGVRVCCGGLVFGNLNEQTFEEIFNNEKYDTIRRAIRVGKPIDKCKNCRWLTKTKKFLYDSADYGIDIPFESRNYEIKPDLIKNGFFDWLDELSEQQIKNQIRKFYNYRFKEMINEALQADESDDSRLRTIYELIKTQSRVVVYPAGNVAKDFSKTAEFSFLKVIAFSDRDTAKHGKVLGGIKIIPPGDILPMSPDAIIVASSANLHDEIIHHLLNLNLVNTQIVSLDSIPWTIS